jgi:pimeloyl-ACP methyl ester carboxylesterase
MPRCPQGVRFGLLMLLACGAMVVHGTERQNADRPTGRYRGDITDPANGDVIMRVAMQVPEQLPAEKHLGLILLFHGSRGNENNYIGLTLAALRRLGLLDRYVVISGKSKGPGWTNDDDAPVLRIIRWAQETYPIDPRRVFVFGSSNGAAYVGRFGSAHQELIAGVVGYCGNYRFAPELNSRPAATRNEWYFVHGGKDRPQSSRRACDELKAAGYRYVFRQMDGYGHTDIWDSIGHPSSDNADAVRDDWLLWMHALRHKEIPPMAEEQKSLAALREKLRKANPGELEPLLKEAERIGGEQGGAVVAEALSSPDAAVRVGAARTADRTLYGPSVTARLIELLRDTSEDVRTAAIRGLGRAANWRSAEAQAALTRIAMATDASSADRLRAIEAVGAASRLPLLGNCEDGSLIWTLVRLLNDDSSQLRTAAFAALKPSGPATFGYNPDQPAAERKAAVEKWRRWCREKCGPAPDGPQ